MRHHQQMSRRAALSTVTLSLVIVVIGGTVTFTPWLGLGRAPVLAAILPARAAVTVAFAVAVAVVVAALLWRPIRMAALSVAVVLGVLVAANGLVLAHRGLQGDQPIAHGTLRVFEWNTNGGLVPPQTVARAAAAARADVVVLPDAGSEAAAEATGTWLNRHGRPVRVFSTGPSAQVAVLIRTGLASSYSAHPGVDPLKTLVLTSTAGPTIIGLHAPQPLLRGLEGWRDDLDWVGNVCARGAAVIVSGDFNASADSFASGHLGTCTDAASTVHAAAVGTWPTAIPPVLGMPLDHTLVSPSAGTAVSWTVLRAEDASGARHRPTIATVGATR